MRGAPDAHYRHTLTRSKVHIGRIHTYHQIQLGNHLQLSRKRVFSSHRLNTGIFTGPSLQYTGLCPTAKQSYPIPSGRQHSHQAFHPFQGPYLALMLGKRGHTDDSGRPIGLFHLPIIAFYHPPVQTTTAEHIVVALP